MILVFDVGATNTRAAVSDGSRLVGITRFATDPSTGGLENLATRLQGLARNYAVTDVIGGFPGQLDIHGTVQLANNLPNWLHQPLKPRLQQALGQNVVISNDVELVGLGEAVAGTGKGYETVAYVTVSTGINAVRLLRGKIDTSVRRFELGNQLVTADSGQPATLEATTGGKALEQAFGRPPAELRSKELWAAEAVRLAQALHNLSLYWTPQAIILGGPMMRDIQIEAVRTAMKQWPLPYDLTPELVPAALKDIAGLHGALAWRAAGR